MSYENSQNNIDFKFKSSTSFSHLIGCVTALIIDYIRSPFPVGFFKTIRTTTEVPYHERMQWLHSVAKKPRPMMVVDPHFDISEDTKFMPNSEFDYLIPNEAGDSKIWTTFDVGKPIITDEANRFEMFAKVSRYKVTFTVTFIFDSNIQQMQSQEHIRQNIRHQSPNPLSRYVENNIPQHFIDAMGIMLNMDVNSDEFMSKINEISKIPITHRIRPGSGNKEFFCLTEATLHTLFTSLPTNNGQEKKGKLVTSSSFTETIEVELAANSTYFLRTNKNVGEQIDMSESAILAQTTVSPTATLQLTGFPVFNDYEEGLKKLQQFNVQFETSESDTLNMIQYINDEIRKVIDYHISQGIEITFIKCKVAENAIRLDGSRIVFDPNALNITVKNTDSYNSYVIALYCNYEYINTIKKSLFAYDDFEDIKKKIKD